MSRIEPGHLDVLHVASFVGNVGDNANHNGTRGQLRRNLGTDLRFEETEMRKYYQNYTGQDSLSFDDRFVRKANENDLVLIGGGSFFDIWIESSATGTTVDLSEEQMDRIDSPVLFHGLGCVPEQDVPEELVDRFRRFLDYSLDSEQTLVSVRNDGSAGRIAETVGRSYADRITTVPDGAFFVEVDSTTHPEVPRQGTVIGVNVVADMRDRRFPGGKDGLTYDEYIVEFSEFADALLETRPDCQLVFIPHIYSDLTAVSDVLSEMDLFHRRNRVTTAPYLHGMGSERYVFDIYDTVDLSMGLRFHSNVCSVGLRTPSIGLTSGHPKVNGLYDELGFPDRTVDVHRPGFSDRLLRNVDRTLSNREQIQRQYGETTESLRDELVGFHERVMELVNHDEQ